MPVFNNILAGAAGSGGAAGFEIERSLRFNYPDTPSLSKTFASAGNRKIWTWSGWVKRSTLRSGSLFTCYTGSNNDAGYFNFEFNGSDKINIGGWNTGYLQTNRVFRDPSAWYHIVLAFDSTQSTQSNRMKLYVNGVQETSFGTANYVGPNADLPINSANNHNVGANAYYTNTDGKFDGYLADVNFIDGQALAPTDFGEPDATTGAWNPKAFSGTYGTNGFYLKFADNSSNAALGTDSSGMGNTWTVTNIQAASSGTGNYIANLTSNGTNTYTQDNANFLKSFDGNLSTEWLLARSSTVVDGTLTFPGGYTMQDANNGLRIYTGASWYISSFLYRKWYQVNGGGYTMMGSTSDTNGVGAPKRWVTIPVPGGTLNSLSVRTHSDNGSWGSGFASAVELDGVILTDNMIASGCDSLIDSPTDYKADTGNNGGNYATLNPLDKHSEFTTSNGNLDAVTSGSSWRSIRGTIGISSGKYYWEFTTGALKVTLGISTSDHGVLDGYVGDTSQGWSYFYDGNKYHASSLSSYGDSYAAGDTIGVAFDADAGNIYFYKNGAIQNSGTAAYTGLTSGPYFPTFSFRDSGSTHSANFGQRPFKHTPPSGYKSLCTQNLDDPLIADGSDHFYALASEGTSGGGTVTDSDANFTPDLVWVKRRNAAERHKVYDILRGTDGTRYNHLETDGNDIEGSGESGITAFVLGGYTSEGGGHINSAGQPFISWMWNAGDLVTNSAYNQSEVWSNSITNSSGGWNASYPITNAFNSVISGANTARSSGAEITTTFTPASGISYSTSVEVWTWYTGSVTLNGGTAVSVSDDQNWRTIHSGSGTLNTLTFDANAGNNIYIAGIRVDGKVLVDKGVIPAGSLNSSFYDQSQTWSNGVSTTRSSNPATQGFDGNNATAAVAPASTPLTITFSGGLTVNSKIEGNGLAPNILINEGLSDETSVTVGAGLQTIYSGSITIQTLKLSYPSNSNAGCFNLLKVDGKVLVDSGVSLSGLTQYPSHASTVCANQTAGFSIVKYVGDNTLGTSYAHGLNSPPSVIIVKNLDTTDNWAVYNKNMGANKYLQLNTIDAMLGNTGWWNDTDPTSSVFYTGNASTTAGNNQEHIAYCMSPVNGYSAMGTYTGNGTGKFIYTGFKVRFLLTKSYSTNSHNNNNWTIYDSERDTNENEAVLYPNSDTFENSHPSLGLDLLSNGFALKGDTSGYSNYNGWDYIYIAFAENPFKYARAV